MDKFLLQKRGMRLWQKFVLAVLLISVLLLTGYLYQTQIDREHTMPEKATQNLILIHCDGNVYSVSIPNSINNPTKLEAFNEGYCASIGEGE